MNSLIESLHLINKEISILIEGLDDVDNKYVQKALKRERQHAVAQYMVGGLITLLFRTIRSRTVWKRTFDRYQKAKADGDTKKADILRGRLAVIKARMINADRDLQEKIKSLPPEKKAEFNKKKSKIIAAAMQRANV